MFMSSNTMVNAGILLLSRPSRFPRFLPVIQEQVKSTLYVDLYSYRFPHLSDESHINPSRALSNIYCPASGLKENLDVRVLLSGVKHPQQASIPTKLQLDVVFFDNNCREGELDKFVQSSFTNIATDCQLVDLGKFVGVSDDEADNATKPTASLVTPVRDNNLQPSLKSSMWNYKMYDNVVLGGTFDRLHSGHKILLSEAILRCTKKLTVGVTETNMLKSKKLWELIEPCAERMNKVEDFLKDVDPSLKYEVVPITDPYGPTKHDPDLQLIVVSAETAKGGDMVNALRVKNGLPTLDIHVVEIMEDYGTITANVEEAKVSSSNDRIRLLGSRLRARKVKPDLPQWPYVIGFTGGIASGKSSMCKRMEPYCVGVVDCDKLAHKLYEKGEICHTLIVEHFGEDILNELGEVNRKKLGSIVFQDKEKMKKLNGILWPRILDRAREEKEKLYKKGHKVVVLEAAILLQAGWDQICHEVWLCIVSPDVAKKRLMDRNKLTETEADLRLASQPTNSELVSCADVVFCTEWDPEFSEYQIAKAWKELHEFLSSRLDD